MDAGSSKFVVVAAVLANVAVAAVKLVAAVAVGSTAMFAEFIHSLIDTGDGLLLLLGRRLSTREADAVHPFGYGKEVYFWSLIVAMVIFGAGGCLTVYRGILHLAHPGPLRHVAWSYIVLGAAALFEGTSFFFAVRSFRSYRRQRLSRYSFWRAVRASKDPTVFTIVFEDGAALIGLLIAFLGVLLATTLHQPRFDAAASLLIGVLLLTVAGVLGRESRGLLLGERVLPQTLEQMCELVSHHEAVEEVIALRTMHLGPKEVLVAVQVRFRPDAPQRWSDAAAELGRALRERFPEIARVWLDSEAFARPAQPLHD